MAAERQRAQGERHVVEQRSPRKQIVLLGDEADVAVGSGDVAAVDPDVPGRWRGQTRDQRQQARFAATARADQRDELAALDIEISGRQRADQHAPTAKVLATPSIRRMALDIRHQRDGRKSLVTSSSNGATLLIAPVSFKNSATFR